MVGQNKNCVGFPLFQFFVVDFWYMCVCYVIRWIIAHTYIIFFSQLVELFTWISLYVTVWGKQKKVKNDLVFWMKKIQKSKPDQKKKFSNRFFFVSFNFTLPNPHFMLLAATSYFFFFFDDDEIDIILSKFESCTFLHTHYTYNRTNDLLFTCS